MFTMTEESQNNPTLKRFRAALDATDGAPLERAVLFGSRARGDAEPGSDYDVAVFLRGDMPPSCIGLLISAPPLLRTLTSSFTQRPIRQGFIMTRASRLCMPSARKRGRQRWRA
jgi:predicted nucleotidyltransferase